MKRSLTLAVGVLALWAARPARADAQCDYPGEGFEQSADFSGVCVPGQSIPAGCPVYVVVEHATTVAFGPPIATVAQAAGGVATAGTPVLVATVDQQASAVDVPDSDCNCDPVFFTLTFDEFEVPIPDAQPGDSVTFSNGPDAHTNNATESGASFISAGPCPAAVWPTSYSFRSECDVCPMDPAGPSDPVGTSHQAGCSVGDSGGGSTASLLFAIALACGLRRRAG